jgi:DNA repair exonuclease SbcCD nuclease subunit
MKILFTADVHIKLGQKNVPLDWAKNRFKMFVEQFGEMQSSADLVVIGGDVFDRLPTMDEVELYFDFVESFTKPTLIYPGNHEMLKKDTTFLTNLKKSTHRLNPLVSVVDDYYENCGFGVDIIPYNKLKDFEKHSREFTGRILCTHVRGEIPPHVKPELDLELFNRWNVVLAGDLHSYENSQRNILYPGSPYTTSFHRSRVDTGAILLDADSLEHTWLKFNLPQLIKRTITADETPVPTDFDHTVYEVQGDMQELGELADSELIASKVIKRDSDSALMLEPEMSLDAEVREYLTYILELPEPTVDKVLKEMQNHAEKLT